MNDGLNVHQFKTTDSHSSVNVNYINKPATKKLAKRKLRLGRIMAVIAVVGGITWLGASAIDSHNYEQVEHPRDTYDTAEGKLKHSHELNERTFVQDYKIVNENATDQDVLDAIYAGEYDYYLDHEGKVRINRELQGEAPKNTDVIAFSEQFLEEHGGKGKR